MTPAFQRQEPSPAHPAALSASTTEPEREAAASHLAHDARNWLTVLQIYCDLLRNSGAVAGKGRNWIEELSNAVKRGQGLVTSLLAQTSTPLEFLAAESALAGPKMLDLAAVLRARGPMLRQMAGSTILVESKTAALAQTTSLREAEFDRILLNLVRNGIDAMPEGGRLTIEVKPGIQSDRRCLVLRVSDTGGGIPAAILPHIFDSGFSTKSTAQYPNSGWGYGLAIVRKLTLAAGGSIRVRSRMGHGTCFILEFPVLLSPAGREPAVSQSRRVAAVSNSSTPVSGSTRRRNNFGAVRKGTRVPC